MVAEEGGNFAFTADHYRRNSDLRGDALLYAAVLAPQDDGLRLTALQQLLLDRRLAEAKKMFAPIASKPHGSAKWRETSGKVMAAIDRGDADAAINLMRGADPEAEGEAAKN